MCADHWPCRGRGGLAPSSQGVGAQRRSGLRALGPPEAGDPSVPSRVTVSVCGSCLSSPKAGLLPSTPAPQPDLIFLQVLFPGWGDTCIPVADSCWCMANTIRIL